MQRRHALGIGGSLICCAGSVIVIAGLAVPTTHAHEKYVDGCDSCHGDFRGPLSPKGTIFPSGDKHDMHRQSSNMGTECVLCHINVGDSPFIGMSAGTATNPGVGCTGCHGRDYGGAIGNSGVGLRLHHVNAGIASCVTCHSDDPLPLPENVLPTYYGTVDTNANDPCNTAPDLLENWSIGDTEGLDNDGDLLYDGDDPDCSVGCAEDLDGDNMVGFQDLLQLLANWGCVGCPADIDGSGTADFQDLLQLLAAWGPC